MRGFRTESGPTLITILFNLKSLRNSSHALSNSILALRSTVLDFAKEVNLLIVLIHQNSLIQTSKTGGQPCSDNITELTHKALLNPEFSESRA